MNKHFLALMVAVACLAAGCENLKEPASKIIADADTSLAALGDDAAKYAPEQMQSVQTELGSLKDDLAKHDYKAVVAGGPKLTADVSALKDAVAAKKAEAEAAVAKTTQEWKDLSTQLPAMLQSIQARLAELSKSKHLPKGVDKSAVAAAKSGLDSIKSTWAEASAASTSGNVQDAIAKAQAAKNKATEIMQSLHIAS
jgi:hypothetical protein